MSDGLFMGGTRLYQQDQAQLAQMAANTALLQEKTRSEIADRELNPLKAELLRSQTTHQTTLADLNRAQASEIAAKGTREERVAAAIAQFLGGGRKASEPVLYDDEGNLMPQPAKPEGRGIDDLAAVGQAVMKAGDLKKGEDLVKLAAELKHKDAQTRAGLAAERVRNANTQVKKIDFTQRVLSGVANSEDHARALMILRASELTKDEPIPAWLQTYDQKKIDQFLAGSKVMREQAEQDRKEADDESKDTARKAATRIRGYLADLAKKRTDAYVERTKNLEKSGGAEKAVPMPGSAEIRLLKQELADEGIEFDVGKGDDAAVAELAEQVKILTTKSRISRKEAIAKVINEEVARGSLVRGEKPATVWGVNVPTTGSKSKYNQKEGTVAVPMALPRTANGSVDRSKLIIGNYYRGDDGTIEQWTRNGGKPVSVATPKGGK